MGKLIEIKMYVDDELDIEGLLKQNDNVNIINNSVTELSSYVNDITKKLIDMGVNLENFTGGKVQTKLQELLDNNLAEVSTVAETIYGNVTLTNMVKVLNALIDSGIIKEDNN